jgi:hypothetical protein
MTDDARVAQEDSHKDLHPINNLAGQSRRAHVVGSEKAGIHSEVQPSLAKSTEVNAASVSKREVGSSSVDARIKLLAETLRSTGRIPQVRRLRAYFNQG